MSLSHLKQHLAGQLRRAADAITPAPEPVILPPGRDIPADPAERAQLYDKIAHTALAWMGSAKLEARAAAASIIKRNYPGINKHIMEAHANAMAFTSQLQELLRAEEARAQAEEGAAPAEASGNAEDVKC